VLAFGIIDLVSAVMFTGSGMMTHPRGADGAAA